MIAVIALFALGVSALFAREVLAYDQGTPKMQEISKAVQEGASGLPAPAVHAPSRRSR